MESFRWFSLAGSFARRTGSLRGLDTDVGIFANAAFRRLDFQKLGHSQKHIRLRFVTFRILRSYQAVEPINDPQVCHWK